MRKMTTTTGSRRENRPPAKSATPQHRDADRASRTAADIGWGGDLRWGHAARARWDYGAIGVRDGGTTRSTTVPTASPATFATGGTTGLMASSTAPAACWTVWVTV